MMSVDINQWRAAIGCFRIFTSRSESFCCAPSFFSVLLQILRLYQFAVCFILILIVILPFTAAVHFFIGHLGYAQSCFLPLFSRTYSYIRIISYVLFELLKRIPFALNSLFRSKFGTIKYLFLVYIQSYAVCIAFNLLYSQWVMTRLILLSGDVEPNPGPDTLKFCCWNLNSIAAHDFLRVSLIEAYNSIYNYDLIGIAETHLNDTIDQERLFLRGYQFIKCNHPLNTKRGGVGLYVKDSLPKKERPDIATLPESIVCELHLDRKKYFFVVVYRSPSQDQQEFVEDAKHKYFANVGRTLSDPSTGTKKYWCLINKILNKAKIPEIPPLLENDIFVLDFSSKAQIFNDYFILQCTTLDTGSEIPNDLLVTASQLREFVISDEKILRIIRNLNPNKAHGWDEISVRMIKMCDSSLIKPLKLIFQNCLRHGIFPETWKRANVVPVHKKNEKNLKENYRPISLLPIFSKILEKLIYESLYSHLERENLLNPNQSGFRPGDSTINQLLSITHSVFEAFDCNPTLEVRSVI